jgi:hypothetical protein
LKNLALVTLSIVFSLVICEVFLRYQPFINLNYERVPERLDPDARISYVTHHKTLGFPDLQEADWGTGCDVEEKVFRVLFLGDSWMESMDGIPKGFADELSRRDLEQSCIRAVNGGVASYSPSLYLLKGETLIEREEFDLVVVNIDETDLMDEYLRYRETTLRSQDGQIERVVPNVVDLMVRYDRAVLQHQPVYILRLIEDVLYYQVLLPRLRQQVFGSRVPVGDYSQIMSLQQSREPMATHAEAIEYFRSVLAEMLVRLSDGVGASRVIVTQHPHYLHLDVAPPDRRYNQALASVLGEEAQRYDVRYYNEFSHVNALPSDQIPQLFRWPEDPFSHLTTEGYQRFGAHIAAYLDETSEMFAKH